MSFSQLTYIHSFVLMHMFIKLPDHIIALIMLLLMGSAVRGHFIHSFFLFGWFFFYLFELLFQTTLMKNELMAHA